MNANNLTAPFIKGSLLYSTVATARQLNNIYVQHFGKKYKWLPVHVNDSSTNLDLMFEELQTVLTIIKKADVYSLCRKHW